MTAQNTPRDERSLQRRLTEMERRLRALETAPRAGKTSLSSGQLTVGDPDADSRIEINAGEQKIIFNSADGPAEIFSPGGAAGTMMQAREDPGPIFPDFGTVALVWNGSYFGSIQASRVDGDTATVQAAVDVTIQDDGGGDSGGQISLTAVGTGAPDVALINLAADGGILITSGGRTTDPPTPPADCVTLYVKSTRLYYRDATGAVHGPL
jgi:hypothetical protein